MKTSTRLLAASALATLFSFAAHAQGEGEGASGMAQPIQSTASASEVKAGARMPVRLWEGSPAVIAPLSSGLTRQAVKAQALIAARTGMTTQGEIGSN